MTNRDRIIRTLRCQPADRAPFGIGFGFMPWGSTVERWRAETGYNEINLHDIFGFDHGFAIVPMEMGPCPAFESQVISEDAEFIVAIDSRGITARNRRDGGSMAEFLDYPVKTPDDWERYKAERLQPHHERRLANLDAFVAAFGDRQSKGDIPIQAGHFPWGVFGAPRDLVGAEELLMGFYEYPEMIRDMMETLTELWIGLFAEIQKRIQIDNIHIWEDMAGRQGSLISMAMVEDFMMPCYDRIADFARDHNIPIVSVDSDGRIDELVTTMMNHGVNVYEPFEVQAGNDILEFRQRHPTLGMLGGLDKRALAEDAPESALHEELDRAAALVEAGGIIPGCDHLIPPNVPWKKWEMFLLELRKIVGA